MAPAGSVVVDDFNGDGIPDIAVGTVSGVSVLFGLGNGVFQPARTFAGPNMANLIVGDFNGDGIPDLAGLSFQVSVALGRGDGSFEWLPFSFISGIEPQAFTVGDFNGDGCLDLAVANSGSNTVSLLFNDCRWGPHLGSSRRRQSVGHSEIRSTNPLYKERLFPISEDDVLFPGPVHAASLDRICRSDVTHFSCLLRDDAPVSLWQSHQKRFGTLARRDLLDSDQRLDLDLLYALEVDQAVPPR